MLSLYRFDLFPQSPLNPSPGGDVDVPLQTWRFTSAPESVSAPDLPVPCLMIPGDVVEPEGGYESVMWEASPLTKLRTAPSMSKEERAFELELEVPLDHPVVSLYLLGPPNGSLWFTHYLQVEGSSDPLLLFVGCVSGCEFKSSYAVLTALALEDVLTRVGNTRRMTRADTFAVYSLESGITPGGGEVIHHGLGTVDDTSADGITITLASLQMADGSPVESGTFDGGFIVIEPLNYSAASASDATVLGFGGQKRSIVEQDGLTITLTTPCYGVNPGDKVIVYRGYNGSFEQCRDVFKNVKRFGGFPYIPEKKDPFVDGATE